MPCPNCHSHNLWDDLLAWGCNDCKWFTTGGTINNLSRHDRFNAGSSDAWKGSQFLPRGGDDDQ